MATWSHYRFKIRLLNKTREYPWCDVIICNEAYTSCTCGCCGFIHNHLDGSKLFYCPQCHLHINRDVNGARNILTLSHSCSLERD
jgi:putative transposase